MSLEDSADSISACSMDSSGRLRFLHGKVEEIDIWSILCELHIVKASAILMSWVPPDWPVLVSTQDNGREGICTLSMKSCQANSNIWSSFMAEQAWKNTCVLSSCCCSEAVLDWWKLALPLTDFFAPTTKFHGAQGLVRIVHKMQPGSRYCTYFAIWAIIWSGESPRHMAPGKPYSCRHIFLMYCPQCIKRRKQIQIIYFFDLSWAPLPPTASAALVAVNLWHL